MIERLNVRPDAGKWYISEGMLAGNGIGINEAQLAFNKSRREMVVAGPFDSRAHAGKALVTLGDAHEPYVWKCENAYR